MCLVETETEKRENLKNELQSQEQEKVSKTWRTGSKFQDNTYFKLSPFTFFKHTLRIERKVKWEDCFTWIKILYMTLQKQL